MTHLFTVLHTAALLSLIRVYPRRPGSAPIPAVCFIGAGIAWIMDTAQLTPSALWSHYLFINAAFAIGLSFVYGQWRATCDRPPTAMLASNSPWGLLTNNPCSAFAERGHGNLFTE